MHFPLIVSIPVAFYFFNPLLLKDLWDQGFFAGPRALNNKETKELFGHVSFEAENIKKKYLSRLKDGRSRERLSACTLIFNPALPGSRLIQYNPAFNRIEIGSSFFNSSNLKTLRMRFEKMYLHELGHINQRRGPPWRFILNETLLSSRRSGYLTFPADFVSASLFYLTEKARKRFDCGFKFGCHIGSDDARDYTVEHLGKLSPALARALKIAEDKLKDIHSWDLRKLCPPIENQDILGCCTAEGGSGEVEYRLKNTYGITDEKMLQRSRLFLYKVTRNLMAGNTGAHGDVGADIRTTFKALHKFGVPPEDAWPYEIKKFDVEPPKYVYDAAAKCQVKLYYRLDKQEMPPEKILEKMKASLIAGIPFEFGFTVYSSIKQSSRDGKIPFASAGDRVIGGHAVEVIGFDDDIEIIHKKTRARTKGALIIRNSWGEKWGEEGYGYLPYEYVLEGAAWDVWAVLSEEDPRIEERQDNLTCAFNAIDKKTGDTSKEAASAGFSRWVRFVLAVQLYVSGTQLYIRLTISKSIIILKLLAAELKDKLVNFIQHIS